MLDGDNLVFIRDGNIFYNNQDFGFKESSFGRLTSSLKLSQGNILYTTDDSRLNMGEIIFNNKAIGNGYNIALSGSNYAYETLQDYAITEDGVTKNVKAPYVIHNGKNLGIGIFPLVSGDHISYFTKEDEDGEWILMLDSKKIDHSSSEDDFSSVSLFGENITYLKKIIEVDNLEQGSLKKYHCFYNSLDLGECRGIYPAKDNFFAIGVDGVLFDKNGEINKLVRNNELGVYIDNLAYVAYAGNSGKENAFVNNKNVGEISLESGGDRIGLSGKNYAFKRIVDGRRHVIYNGLDLGEGINPVMPDMHKGNSLCAVSYDYQSGMAIEKIKECQNNYQGEEALACMGLVVDDFQDIALCEEFPDSYVAVCKHEYQQRYGGIEQNTTEESEHFLFRRGKADLEYERMFDVQLFANGISLSLKDDLEVLMKHENPEFEMLKIVYGKMLNDDDDFSMEKIVENRSDKLAAGRYDICLDDLEPATEYIFQPIFVDNTGKENSDDMSSFTTLNNGSTLLCSDNFSSKYAIENLNISTTTDRLTFEWDFPLDYPGGIYLYTSPDFYSSESRLSSGLAEKISEIRYRVVFDNLKTVLEYKNIKEPVLYFLIEMKYLEASIYKQGELRLGSDFVKLDNVAGDLRFAESVDEDCPSGCVLTISECKDSTCEKKCQCPDSPDTPRTVNKEDLFYDAYCQTEQADRLNCVTEMIELCFVSGGDSIVNLKIEDRDYSSFSDLELVEDQAIESEYCDCGDNEWSFEYGCLGK